MLRLPYASFLQGATPVSLHDLKILAVDDDPSALEAVVDLLRTDGHEVHAATSAEEAVELLHRDSYHLVLTDVVMPGKGGLWLARLVRDKLPRTPVVLVSGRCTLDDAREGLRLGAADYLQKPLEPSTLRGIVARLLEGAPRLPPNRLLAEPTTVVARGAPSEPTAISIPIGTPMKAIEREVIARTLDALRWNKNRTAQVLGISRRSLYNKLERFGITRPAPPLGAGPLAAGAPLPPPAPAPAAPEPPPGLAATTHDAGEAPRARR